jgi:metal-responsive CopG/Arc/MetJ family transcriptional regulator
MKTIAISIDEASLAALDRLALSGRRRPGRTRRGNRSEVVRRALQEFIARQRKQKREEGDARILRAHRDLLARQAAVLVREQAEP